MKMFFSHGHTRTTLTNIRVGMGFPENAERGCTYGKAVRLPEAEGRAAKRSQETARGSSVLVCGSKISIVKGTK